MTGPLHDDEAAHSVSVVLLFVVSVLFFGVILFTGLATWLTAEPFGGSPINLPRAAGVVVGSASVAAQVLSMVFVARSTSPLVLRVLIVATGAGICVLHCLTLASVVKHWQTWGSAPHFWPKDASSLWQSLALSALAPLIFYTLAWLTRHTASPR